MNRREAIKGLGLSIGFVVATPTVMSLLQSCKNDPKIEWTPEFFTPEEGVAIKKLVGLILPKTEKLPGANEVNVPQFIDKYVYLVSGKEEQENYKKNIESIVKALGKPATDVSDTDYDKLLAKYLKATPEQMEAFQQNEEDKNVFNALMGLRGMAIWGYKNSKLVGTEVLAYDPVPGTYKGCVSLEKITGGRSWSL